MSDDVNRERVGRSVGHAWSKAMSHLNLPESSHEHVCHKFCCDSFHPEILAQNTPTVPPVTTNKRTGLPAGLERSLGMILCIVMVLPVLMVVTNETGLQATFNHFQSTRTSPKSITGVRRRRDV